MTCKLRKLVPVLFITVAALIFSFTVTGNALANTETSDSKKLLGDADSDGVVTIRDVTMIQWDIAKFPVPDRYSEIAADADGNGTINIEDATIIQRWLAKYETPFQIGEPVEFPEPATEPSTQMPTDDEGWGRTVFQP